MCWKATSDCLPAFCALREAPGSWAAAGFCPTSGSTELQFFPTCDTLTVVSPAAGRLPRRLRPCDETALAEGKGKYGTCARSCRLPSVPLVGRTAAMGGCQTHVGGSASGEDSTDAPGLKRHIKAIRPF
ncbi:hypothetical protein GN956_G26503 [Arapaima gigas]